MEPIKLRNLSSVIFACAADLSNALDGKWRANQIAGFIVDSVFCEDTETADEVLKEVNKLIVANKNKVKYP